MQTMRPAATDERARYGRLRREQGPAVEEVYEIARAMVDEVRLVAEISRTSVPGPVDLRSLDLVRGRLGALLVALYGDGRRPTAAETEGLRVIRDLLHQACSEWELDA